MEKLEKSGKKIEIISGNTNVKESDKQEGIDMYGGKPLGEKEGNYVNKKTTKEIEQEISELKKSWKSTNYVGDKSSIEKEIIKLEDELRGLGRHTDEKIKTSKELAMEGNIAWKKNTEENEIKSEKETKEITENEIKKTKLEINNLDEKLKNLDKDDEKLKKELEELGLSKDEIENKIKIQVVPKKTSETIPVTVKKEETPLNISKNENKESKEKYSREQLLNAAEVFCKYNSAAYYKDPIEQKIAQERALSELKEKHSEREIAAAVNVSTKRNEMFGLKDKIKRIEEEYKNARENPSAEISTVKAKYDQQIQNIKREMRLIDNDYNPLLRELKIANLDSQLKNLEKYRDHKDFKEKTQDAELFALSMIQTEMVRYQDAKVSSNSVINPKGWDHIKNLFKRSISENRFFQGYMKMGRGKRMAISAAIIGATSGFVPVTLIAGAISLVAGGVGGYLLSKKVFQPLARKAYEHDSARTTQSQQNEALASSEMAHLEKLARGETDPTEREKILGKIADFNIEMCTKYSDRIRRDKKYYIANNVLGTVAAGLIAGRGARLMGNYIAGSGILGIGGKTTIPTEHTPHKGGGVAPLPGEEHIPKGGGGTPPETIIPSKPVNPGINPDDMKAATVGKGEGIEHALRRQLEMHPDKFGFKGDLTNKAAIHEWSGGKAHLVAIDQHYVNNNGTETWVKDMGPAGPEGNPAYVLDVDATGKSTIHEFFEGKPSGTGGVNSPYEYMHDTPTSPRYTSALDNVPEQGGGNSGNDWNTPEQTGNGDVIEYGDNSGTGPGKGILETGHESTAKHLGTTYDTPDGSTFQNVQQHVQDVYEKNINHIFPKDAGSNWLEKGGLPAKELLKTQEPGQLTELSNYLHKIEEVTGLKPKGGSFFQSAETVHRFVNRGIQKAAELGKLEDLRLK